MLQFILWAVGSYVALGIANMILALPVGVVAQSKWSELDLKAKEQNLPTSSLLPIPTWLTLGYGVVGGTILAVVFAILTLWYISDHWVYQISLMGLFLFASMHAQSSWMKSSPGFFGETGDKFCSVMFGGYFWGSLIALIIFNLARIV